jgi:MFS family permease
MRDPGVGQHRVIMRSISGLLIGTFFATLSTNILATALPRILASLRVSVDGYTWVVTAYILMLTVSVPVWGKLADLWDQKRLLQLTIALYLAGSVIGGCATSSLVLIIGRSVQGLGTGGLAALGQVVLASLIAPRQRGRYSGYSGAVFALGTVAGPLIGGALVVTPLLNWRACFLVSVPFGLMSLLLISRNLHLPPTARREVHVDVLGALLVVADASVILVWVSLAGTKFPWWGWQTAVAAAGVVVLTCSFAATEFRIAEPIVRLTLFQDRSVALAAAASFFSGIVAFATPLFLAQYFQLGHGLTPFESGLATMPAIAGIFLATWGAGRLITLSGRMKPFLVVGAVCQIAGVAALAAVASQGSVATMIGPMFVTGLGIGVLQQNVVLLVQNIIPAADLGAGSGITQFSRFLGGALGVSVLGAVSAMRVARHVTAGLRAARLPVPPGLSVDVPNLRVMPQIAAAIYEHGYAHAFADTFGVLAPFLAVPLVAVFAMRDVRLGNSVRIIRDDTPPREPSAVPEQ